MRYKKFTIRNYRAINGPLEINVEKPSLMPIVGINESGKTTVLHALFAFDCWNDNLNDQGRHLKDIANLYRTSSHSATIEAKIEFTKAELKEALSEAAEDAKDTPSITAEADWLSRRRTLPSAVTITRNLATRRYSISPQDFGGSELQDIVARRIIAQLPYILYFDDFRDKIPGKIEIPSSKEAEKTEWLEIIEQLFRQTDPGFKVFQLATMEERRRKTVLAKVERHLNAALTREWQTFRLDDRDALKVSVDFFPDQGKNFLKLDVVERDSNGDEHCFFISDRSKGFYWFFNFVMKLEFNPKFVSDDASAVSSGDASAIYLLDEPGSYLHAFAQRKLCQKLRQISSKNWVAYCTHSHYLLDPEVIPVNKITVADKDRDGNISLIPITRYKGAATEKRSALQPVLDALQVRPFGLDSISPAYTVVTEGIYDYFAIQLFRGSREVSVLPSVGADSMKFYISMMIAWQIDFCAVWDNDPEGRKKSGEAEKHFGEEIASRHFRLLPFGPPNGHFILQNMFDGTDLTRIRQELDLDADCSFERTLQALFYSSRRDELVRAMSATTRGNFEKLFQSLPNFQA
jgi:predicted ATPase